MRDEILRQRNGPDIALFLGFAPDVIEQLCKMHPLDAARCIESISEDLERATIPGEGTDYGSWKAARDQCAAKKQNLVKKSKAKL